ncbi:MAG: ATP-binding protein, partial [Lachnospiraceae bacterium]|nr:ATP-binding protein [Lachnospiraceae bacterium]
YYIDKTGMIRDLIHSWGAVNLFTRPSRFGKYLNIDMLNTFFEIGADASYFEGLEIMQETELCEKYMGKFPVISITLKDVEGEDFESACDALGTVISDEADRQVHLLDSDKLTPYDKKKLESILEGQFDKKDDLKNSLKTLSKLLYKHYGQKVILLIDEYDVPLDKAYQNGYYEQMVSVIRGLLGKALKSNDTLYIAVITGCLRIAKESIFTGLNNFKVNTISDTRFAQYFGFTDSEVKDLLHYYDLDEFYASIKEWYDGYHFGELEMYCPWDVLNYCDKLLANRNCKPEAFWANSSSNYIIQDILSHATETAKRQIELLISGDPIEQRIIPELTYTDLNNEDFTIRETYLWSVLYAAGYLTKASEETRGELHKLIIPNREILQIYRDKIQSWYNINVRRDTQKWQEFCNAVKTGNANKVQELFNSYMSRTISIRDTFVKKEMKENFYHGMLLGILQCDGSWIIKSNQESGLGYCDILLLVPGDKIGCAIELKYAENGAFDAACNEALKQISEKKYTDYLLQE